MCRPAGECGAPRAAGALLASGATRVVVGTAAVERPAFVEELCQLHPGAIAVGLDARGRDVAVRGWESDAGVDLLELAGRFEDVGVAALVVTEIRRDGTMEGPSLDQLRSVLEATALPVIASGGIGALSDLQALAEVESGGRRLAGCDRGAGDLRRPLHRCRGAGSRSSLTTGIGAGRGAKGYGPGAARRRGPSGHRPGARTTPAPERRSRG